MSREEHGNDDAQHTEFSSRRMTSVRFFAGELIEMLWYRVRSFATISQKTASARKVERERGVGPRLVETHMG